MKTPMQIATGRDSVEDIIREKNEVENYADKDPILLNKLWKEMVMWRDIEASMNYYLRKGGCHVPLSSL